MTPLTMTPDLRITAIDHQRRLAEPPYAAALGYAPLFPHAARVSAGRLSLLSEQGVPVTEALYGEAMEVLDVRGQVAWVRTVHDRYLGWADVAGIDFAGDVAGDVTSNVGTPGDFGSVNTLSITALRAHLYAQPAVSSARMLELSLGAQVARRAGNVITEQGRRWIPVAGGYLQEVCTSPLPDTDAAALAVRFVGTPYVWGGRSAWGLDCSGLTQLCYAAFGAALPRDADQQRATLRQVSTPQRGDLAFFPGHVGLMLNERQMVHASATTMQVALNELGTGEYGQQLASALIGFGRVGEAD